MDAAGNEINWSEVARPSLTAAVTAFEHRQGGNMTTAIERLRASRQQAQQKDAISGKEEGRDWAERRAEYRWLKSLALRRHKYPNEDPAHSLDCVIDPDEQITSPDEFEDLCYPLSKSPSDEYMEAFVAGALEFFSEVREQVEQD
jgi:hypothetical protein